MLNANLIHTMAIFTVFRTGHVLLVQHVLYEQSPCADVVRLSPPADISKTTTWQPMSNSVGKSTAAALISPPNNLAIPTHAMPEDVRSMGMLRGSSKREIPAFGLRFYA